MTRAIIISGFPGIGKSEAVRRLKAANSSLSISDSDSSKFPKDAFPENYLNHIEKLSDGFMDIMLVSSHDATRSGLVARGLPYILVYPSGDQKEEYLERYRERGSPEPFLKLMDDKWDEFITGCENQTGCEHIVLEPGQYLSDVLDQLAAANMTPYPGAGVDE